jgi:hypothetical protein
MTSIHNVTVLESLPDELLVVILSYLHTVDRLRTFNNLNSRFDQCLLEVGVGIEDDLAADELIRNKFASRITFIRCYKRNEELELDQFPAIRSLTLYDGVWPQIYAINPLSMPCISHISLKTNSIFSIDEPHSDLLLEVICGKFPWLTSIHLSNSIFHFDEELLDLFIPSFRIRSATIGSCHISTFEVLLGYLPTLIMLTIGIDQWHLANTVEDVKIIPDDWSHDSLSFLTLKIDFPFNERNLDWLEQRLPALLHIEVDNQHDCNHPIRKWYIEYITDDEDDDDE